MDLDPRLPESVKMVLSAFESPATRKRKRYQRFEQLVDDVRTPLVGRLVGDR